MSYSKLKNLIHDGEGLAVEFKCCENELTNDVCSKIARELVSNILRCKDKADEITRLKTSLSDAVKKLAVGTRPHNTLLIKNMSEKLRDLVSEA